MDWSHAIDEFCAFKLERGRFQVVFDYLEDGDLYPFYHPEDPEDRPMLHLTVLVRGEDGWEVVEGLNCPTSMTITMVTNILAGYAAQLINRLEECFSIRELYQTFCWFRKEREEEVLEEALAS